MQLPRAHRTAKGPSLVLATLPGERHELGLLFAALLAARSGYRCVYLGSDLPLAEMVAAVRRTQAKALALSVIQSVSRGQLETSLESLMRALPRDVELWLGGAGAQSLADPLRGQGTVMHTLAAFEDRLAGAH